MAEKLLPEDTGNEWGETVVEERKIRIMAGPGADLSPLVAPVTPSRSDAAGADVAPLLKPLSVCFSVPVSLPLLCRCCCVCHCRCRFRCKCQSLRQCSAVFTCERPFVCGVVCHRLRGARWLGHRQRANRGRLCTRRRLQHNADRCEPSRGCPLSFMPVGSGWCWVRDDVGCGCKCGRRWGRSWCQV
jgi:hypothetical protein